MAADPTIGELCKAKAIADEDVTADLRFAAFADLVLLDLLPSRVPSPVAGNLLLFLPLPVGLGSGHI
jgi:hypothetical protein